MRSFHSLCCGCGAVALRFFSWFSNTAQLWCDVVAVTTATTCGPQFETMTAILNFLHTQSVIRRRHNTVVGLNINGIWVTDEDSLKREAVSLISSSLSSAQMILAALIVCTFKRFPRSTWTFIRNYLSQFPSLRLRILCFPWIRIKLTILMDSSLSSSKLTGTLWLKMFGISCLMLLLVATLIPSWQRP